MPAKNKRNSSGVSKLLSFVAWLTGVIVSFAVGFALISGTLLVPYIGVANLIAGYIVVITTALGAILAIFNR